MLKMLVRAHILATDPRDSDNDSEKTSIPGVELGPELAVAADYALLVAAAVEDAEGDSQN